MARHTPVEGTAPSRPASSRGSGTATRERILDVALDLFTRKGYAETSLREIAEELGFSKAALYYHFESKQDILLALHMRVHGLTESIHPLLQNSPDNTVERVIDQLIGFALQNRRLLELHARNQEAIADLHREGAPQKHGGLPGSDLEQRFLDLLRDPAVPIEARVRRIAAVGAIAGVLLASDAFADVPDAALESALRAVAHDILAARSG